MKSILFALVLLIGAVNTSQAQPRLLPPEQCAVHVPYGAPNAARTDATPICRQGYFLLHDNIAKIPAWGAWMITPQTVNGCHARSNNFITDQSLPAGKRSTEQDYAGTGYDKGHLANDAHQSWSRETGNESFLMSNMMPQLPGLNRGIWKLLETATGAWVYSRQTNILVYAGPIYQYNNPTIGNNKVIIPSGFYKIIIDTRTGETLAFLFPHQERLGNDLSVVQSTVAQIEQYAGVRFPVPANMDKNVKLPIWPIDFKGVADAKRKQCRQ